jgi:hypothetical protein
MTAHVFIPSRGRAEMLAAKVMPKWMQQNAKVFIVVERSQYIEYAKAMKGFCNQGGSVDVLPLPESDRGINYSRNWIVKTADEWGCRKIIQADDDIWPSPATDVNRLFEWEGLNCLGIGIMVPFYGLMFGNQTIKDEDRPLMSKGALGKRLFSLNVPRVLAAGNFDVNLHSGWGDDELVRAGMACLKATWYVHAGVWGGSVSGRYTKGGINDFHQEDEQSRLKGQEHSHRIIYDRWGPRYVSDPYKKMTFRWQKFMDDKVPRWRDRIDWVKM